MLNLTACESRLLDLVDAVVNELLESSTRLRAADMMVVGANCRDILQSALGHSFALRATTDIDLGLAVANWEAYGELTRALTSTGDTGIRFRVAGMPADLVPFGAVEDPPGTVRPTADQSMSVWGFAEVFREALPLALPGGATVRIPSVAGYTALKLAAWLDRSDYGEYKDASDIATAMYWYVSSSYTETYLYEVDHGQEILMKEELDSSAAAAHLLGADIASLIGGVRLAELADRWPGPKEDLLYPSMTVINAPGWTQSAGRRRGLIRAMERGMGLAPDR